MDRHRSGSAIIRSTGTPVSFSAPGPTYCVSDLVGIVGIDGLDVEDRRVLLDHRAERELRLPEALLGIVARAHIGQEPEEVVQLPVLVQHRRRGVVHPHPPTVRVTHPILVLERLEVGVVEGVDLAESGEVVGMHDLEPQVGPLQEPFGLIPQDALDLRAHEAHHRHAVGADVIGVGHRRDPLDHRPEPCLGLTEPRLGLDAFGHADEEALPVQDLAGVAQDRANLVPDPGPRSVRRSHPVRLVEGGATRESGPVRDLHSGAVVGVDVSPPPLAIAERDLGRVPEQVVELGADEGQTPTLRIVRLHVRDGRVLLHEPLVPDLGVPSAGVRPVGLLGRAEHPRRRAE